jgi:hypothetical protein
MQKWLRGFRGLVVMAMTWAAGWGLGGGGVMEVFVDPHGEIEDIWPNVLAIPGFVGGALFYAMLWIPAVLGRFHELSLPRCASLAALPSAHLAVLALSLGALRRALPNVWLRAAALVGPAILLGAMSGIGVALVYRYAARRQRLASSPPAV